MKTSEIKELTTRFIINSYGDRPIALERGQGIYVWDPEGNKYLDFVAGIAVNILGHCHPKIIQAVEKQVRTLIHVSNLYYTEPQARLAEFLSIHSLGGKCFFCNSGAEANEGAIKLARKYGKTISAEDKYEIITLKGSFHGRTYAAITATGQDKYHHGFEPLVPGFKYASLNDLSSVEALISNKTCAVLLEPVQGESGVHPCTPEFLAGVRSLCDKYNALLIFDEVQCGLGRTGKLFAYEHYNVKPDVMTLAKGLAGGLPMGAVVTTNRVADVFTPGNHASTFGGNPLCAAAALATMETIFADNLLNRAEQMGNYLVSCLKFLQQDFPMITEIRGKGLMIGAQLDRPGAAIVQEAIAKGLLINCAANTTLRFVPPLIVTKADIDSAITILRQTLSEQNS
jgi:predicted acetylornithine/succinylornithine family transaminase